MSLPTLYRSTLLSGQSNGWTTHAIDMSGFLGEDYVQIGYNSVYGGGNAHPTYNWASARYYMITDRMNVELTDNAMVTPGTSPVHQWTDTMTVHSEETLVSHHRTVKHTDTVTTQHVMITATESLLDGIGLKQTTHLYNTTHSTTGVTTAHHGHGSNYAPPEGLSGYYNVCLDYASAYSNRPGDSVRLTMPVSRLKRY